MNVFTLPWAILRNVYSGMWVLAAELYWLAGPDFVYRYSRGKRAAAIARCRERLYLCGTGTQAELDTLEAENAAAAACFAEKRTHFLERLRQRGGLDACASKE